MEHEQVQIFSELAFFSRFSPIRPRNLAILLNLARFYNFMELGL